MTDQELTEALKPIAEEIAKNCGSVPQLTFPHLYLGVRDLLAQHAANAEPLAATPEDLKIYGAMTENYLRDRANAEQRGEQALPYAWKTREGKQHDTGRVVTASGSFFADTASPDDAQLIAEALNALASQASQPQPVQGKAVPAATVQMSYSDDGTRATGLVAVLHSYFPAGTLLYAQPAATQAAHPNAQPATASQPQQVREPLIPRGFKVAHNSDWDALTDEANERSRWSVERIEPPFCGDDDVMFWTGKTLQEAMSTAFSALGITNTAKGSGE